MSHFFFFFRIVLKLPHGHPVKSGVATARRRLGRGPPVAHGQRRGAAGRGAAPVLRRRRCNGRWDGDGGWGDGGMGGYVDFIGNFWV